MMRTSSAMSKVSLRNILAHKLRLALTVLAVVLGTAFIAGSLMLTNMLERTFSGAVSSQFDGVDVVAGPGESMPSIPKATIDSLRDDPDVDRINIVDSATVVAGTGDGDPIQTGQGRSTSSIYYSPEEVVGEGVELVDGHAPEALGEAIINRDAAEEYGVSLDQKLIVVDPLGRQNYTVVGFYDSEDELGSSLAFKVSPETFEKFYTDGQSAPRVAIAAREGVAPDTLVESLRSAHPELDVDTGEVLAKEASEFIRDALSFVSYFLIAFGLVGLMVGTFLIANTFSMIVAQRTKEFALLRALGASKSQISRSVTLEALIVGLIGSSVGVLAGAGLVAVIKLVMESNGMPLPGGGIGLSVQAVIVPIIVGVIVTILSAWAPARRAGRVQPVEAMRSSESASPQPLRVRTIIGVVLIIVAIAAAVTGVVWEDGSTGNRAWLIAGAAVAVITGMFLAGPALSLPIVPPFGRLIGLPFGAVGTLASTNTQRNPRRTSATAFALMLGIMLVTVIGMLGASMKHSIADVVESEFGADYILTAPEIGSFPLPADLSQRVADVDGVGGVVAYGSTPVVISEDSGSSSGFPPVTLAFDGDPRDLINLTMAQGSSSLDGDTIIAPQQLATNRGWSVGDKVNLAAPGLSAETVEATIGGIFEDTNVMQGAAVGSQTAVKLVPPATFTIIMVGVNNDGSVDNETLRENLQEAVRADMVVQVRSSEDMSGEITGLIDQMLFILYALLSLAVIIAILGIVNTLTLSVIERRQEIGMLRAVGAKRGQVRTMIILESVQMAVFGAVMGTLMGLGLGWAFLTVLADEGLKDVVVPGALIATMLGGSVVVGILAALWPAQRAAKTPPLDAIAN